MTMAFGKTMLSLVTVTITILTNLCFNQSLFDVIPRSGQMIQNKQTAMDADLSYKDLKPLHDHKRLLSLIAKRLQLAHQVAQYKYQNNFPVFDAQREKSILARVVVKAGSSGLDTKWSSAFFQDQMEANRKLQEYLIGKWKRDNVKFVGESRKDLLHVTIRPQIDQINNELIILAISTHILRSSEWCRVLTDFELSQIIHTFADINEADIFCNYALRNICLDHSH